MATAFCDLVVFDVYLVHEGVPSPLFASTRFEEALCYARKIDRFAVHAKPWMICRSSGIPDPTIDLMLAESYWPMAETMQADQLTREDVFA